MKNHKSKQTRSFNADKISNELYHAYLADLATLPVHKLYAHGNTFNLYDSLQSAFLRKYKTGDHDEEIISRATKGRFLDNLLRMSQVSIPTDSRSNRILNRAANIIYHVLGTFSDEELFIESRHSGGSTIGCSFKDSSIFAKSTAPITTTRSAYYLFLYNYCQWDRSMLDMLLQHNQTDNVFSLFKIVEGSRYDEVPKSNEINRSIGVEPTLPMFFQQGAMKMFYKRLARFGLSVDDLQEQHKDRALHGSVTRMLSTIDFSMASDSLSLVLVERLLPPRWFQLLKTIGSPHMVFGNDIIDLPIMSTMGNATTFPLETLIFWSIACSLKLEHEQYPSTILSKKEVRTFSKEISCYGDDLIIPVEISDLCLEFFPRLGLMVNAEKSFTSRDCSFRESCGGDFFHFHDVRPIYLRRPSSTTKAALEAWLYDITNRVLKKYFSYFGHGGCYRTNFLKCACTWLSRLNPRGQIYLVPGYMPESSGMHWSNEVFTRFIAENFKVSPLRANVHGQVKYCYLRYLYLSPEEFAHTRNEVAYYFAKKDRLQFKTKSEFVYRQRTKGRYIRACGLTSFVNSTHLGRVVAG